MHSYCERGEQLELKISRNLHREGVPVLISPMFLREYGQGQVDIAVAKRVGGEWQVYCYEVKSSSIISGHQIRRLKGSACLISAIFGVSTKIYFSSRCENLCQIN